MHRTTELTVQKMSNEVEVVDVEIPMFSCNEDKYMGRVSKTINLEGYCSAVEIRTRVEKMDSHWPGKG